MAKKPRDYPDRHSRGLAAKTLGGRLLTPQEAAKAAGQAVAELIDDAVWQPAFKGAKARPALLVRRLDLPDDYYYIVPYEKQVSNGRKTKPVETARVLIDGKTGDLQQIGAIEAPGQALTPFVNPKKEIFRLAQEQVRRSDGQAIDFFGEQIWVRPETVTVHKELAWRSCDQTRSPLRPFFMLSVRDINLYLRVDGGVARKLTGLNSGA